MHVCAAYKNEDQIKDEGDRVVTTFYQLKIYDDYSRRSSAAYFNVLSESWAKFELRRWFCCCWFVVGCNCRCGIL